MWMRSFLWGVSWKKWRGKREGVSVFVSQMILERNACFIRETFLDVFWRAGHRKHPVQSFHFRAFE
jgi:hypothetical protein